MAEDNNQMTVGQLKKHLEEFGSGADDCVIRLTTYSPTGRLSRYYIDTEVAVVLTPPYLNLAIGRRKME